MSDQSLREAMAAPIRPDYKLTLANEPRPKLLDEEIATTNWPLPDPKPFQPIQPQSMWARWVAVAVAMWGAMNA